MSPIYVVSPSGPGQINDLPASTSSLPAGTVVDSSVDPASPISAPASPRNRALRDFVSLLDYGTYISGDMSSVLATARGDAQTRSKVLYVPSNQYLITTPTNNTANKGPLLVVGDDPSTAVFNQGAGSTDSIFRTIGSSTLNVASVTSPVSAGSNVLHLSSTASLSPQMVIFLRDTSVYATQTGMTPTNAGIVGEFARVYTVDSSTQVTLHQALDFAYTTNAQVSTLAGQVVHFSGIGFVNLFPDSQSQAGGSPINIAYFEDFQADHCEFSFIDWNGIALQRGLDWRVTNCRFIDFQENNATGGSDAGRTPYCVDVDVAVSHGLMQGCMGRYGRHMITASGGSASEFGSSHVKVADCIATEFAGTSFDTHPGARQFTFSDCTVHGSFPEQGTAAVHGFQIRGPDTRIVDCNVFNLPASTGVNMTSYGVYVYGGSHRFHLSGGNFDTMDYAVWIVDSDDCLIDGSARFANVRNQPIQLQYDSGWSGLITNPVRLGSMHFKNAPAGSPINANAGALTYPEVFVA
jgi:hypothetical protein